MIIITTKQKEVTWWICWSDNYSCKKAVALSFQQIELNAPMNAGHSNDGFHTPLEGSSTSLYAASHIESSLLTSINRNIYNFV